MPKKLDLKIAVAVILAALAVCILVTAVLDYVVLAWVIGIGYQANFLYGECLTLEMIAFGVLGALFIKVESLRTSTVQERRLGTVLSIAVLAAIAVFVVGNLEDWLYFIVGSLFFGHAFPAWSLQWSWMPCATGVLGLPSVSSLLGFRGSWTTVNQAWWTGIWRFAVLPAVTAAVFKFPVKK